MNSRCLTSQKSVLISWKSTYPLPSLGGGGGRPFAVSAVFPDKIGHSLLIISLSSEIPPSAAQAITIIHYNMLWSAHTHFVGVKGHHMCAIEIMAPVKRLGHGTGGWRVNKEWPNSQLALEGSSDMLFMQWRSVWKSGAKNNCCTISPLPYPLLLTSTIDTIEYVPGIGNGAELENNPCYCADSAMLLFVHCC
jgi:hypothetical protein